VAIRIAPDFIGFDTLPDLNRFLSEQSLHNGFQLAVPIKDNAGNVLIKEHIVVKENALKRLETMEGNYNADFQVMITKDLLKQLRASLSKSLLSLIDRQDMSLVRHLFEATRVNYHPIVQNALSSGMLVLTFYKMHHENIEFFEHAGKLGLLALGIVVQKQFGVPRLHRYSLLGGFLADVGLANSNEWAGPISEQRRLELAKQASAIAQRLALPAEISSALTEATIVVNKPTADTTPIEILDPSAPRAGSPDTSVEELDQPAGPVDQRTASVLTEVLRLALFVHESWKQLAAEKDVERLISMVAYNGGRGYFHKDLVELLIERFREYEIAARRMMRIAEIEKKCIHPPSAWAYPKPRSAQILCRHFVTSCPKLVSGWDIHIVSPQEAYGWLGTVLEAGMYPKCALETELQNLESRKPG
jgi:hypothetical protein